jgi:transposase
VLERINPDAAGIDCGATTHVVAVPPDRDNEPVQSFRTFTTDLQRLADWLVACRITSVALESTGVFWIPIYEILEARGLSVHLVNARHVRNLPGRKSDVSDAEWLRDLHSVGLLHASFRPTAAIVTLRTYMRHRHSLVELAAIHIQRMQKALVQMNLQLPFVISDITGQTGLQIIRAIVAGERDPAQLARFRHGRCRATAAEITAALTGHYRRLLAALQQNLALYDACSDGSPSATAIEATYTADRDIATGRSARGRPATHRTAFEVRAMLHHLTGGVDSRRLTGSEPTRR